MNKEQDYASDSDDEDFCPEKAGADAAAASEDESEDEEGEDQEGETSNKKTLKGRKKVLTKKSMKTKSHSDDDDEEEEINEGSRRSTRQTEAADSEREKSKHDKDELDSDDNEKSRTDALWADFLGDVKQPVTTKKSNTSTLDIASSSKADTITASPPSLEVKKTTLEVEKPKQITVTEIVDFAGEEVRVEKTVSAESIKENKVAAVAGISGRSGFLGGLKRPSAGGSGGLGSLLNQLGKKKKLSVLEKTKLDWSGFKQDEGIDEQLQTFNKGKDGYLERQDFLQRTDLRQFEIEKNLRQTRRNNN